MLLVRILLPVMVSGYLFVFLVRVSCSCFLFVLPVRISCSCFLFGFLVRVSCSCFLLGFARAQHLKLRQGRYDQERGREEAGARALGFLRACRCRQVAGHPGTHPPFSQTPPIHQLYIMRVIDPAIK
jgi:hypothetical protein